MKIILAYDESGAKGYLDQDEQFPGQVSASTVSTGSAKMNPALVAAKIKGAG
jgi:hypothetical protein